MMKWMKYFAGFTLTALTVAMMTACGSVPLELDTAAAADTLMQQVAFDTELSKANEVTAGLMFSLPEGVQAELYLGDGAYADELAVFTCENKESLSAVQSAVETHLMDKKSEFEKYMPEQVSKIENAVVTVKEPYVILCVSGDGNAASVVDSVMQ